MRRLFALVVVFGVTGCAQEAPLPAPGAGPRSAAVHVASNGWHTAIVLARDEVAATGALPEVAHFPDAVYLEFGWGDRAYFMTPDPSVGTALEAALTPTPAVMHVVGLARPPGEAYPEAEIVTLKLTEAAQRRLIRALAGQIAREGGAPAKPLSKGLSADSYFYPALGSFHLFNTCNTWTARMLRAGGVGISASGVITADELLKRLVTSIGTAR